jgi:hypothetical protein
MRLSLILSENTATSIVLCSKTRHREADSFSKVLETGNNVADRADCAA